MFIKNFLLKKYEEYLIFDVKSVKKKRDNNKLTYLKPRQITVNNNRQCFELRKA